MVVKRKRKGQRKREGYAKRRKAKERGEGRGVKRRAVETKGGGQVWSIQVYAFVLLVRGRRLEFENDDVRNNRTHYAAVLDRMRAEIGTSPDSLGGTLT
eukprot:1619170-Pleurochrysis_carterae.AAC.2